MKDCLEKEILKCYDENYGCAVSVLKAFENKYRLKSHSEIDNMCDSISNGLGIGCFCAAISVCVMCFGRMFDKATAKRMRIRFLTEFYEQYPSMDCGNLKKSGTISGGCDKMLGTIGRLAEDIIDDELTFSKPLHRG